MPRLGSLPQKTYPIRVRVGVGVGVRVPSAENLIRTEERLELALVPEGGGRGSALERMRDRVRVRVRVRVRGGDQR